jgi:hypothetical protein
VGGKPGVVCGVVGGRLGEGFIEGKLVTLDVAGEVGEAKIVG